MRTWAASGSSRKPRPCVRAPCTAAARLFSPSERSNPRGRRSAASLPPIGQIPAGAGPYTRHDDETNPPGSVRSVGAVRLSEERGDGRAADRSFRQGHRGGAESARGSDDAAGREPPSRAARPRRTSCWRRRRQRARSARRCPRAARDRQPGRRKRFGASRASPRSTTSRPPRSRRSSRCRRSSSSSTTGRPRSPSSFPGPRRATWPRRWASTSPSRVGRAWARGSGASGPWLRTTPPGSSTTGGPAGRS